MSGTVQDWPKSYGELYCKHVTLLLQRIYETEKSLSKMPSMRYENLLPDHLLRKPVRIEGIAECSKQERGRIPQNGSFIIDLSQRKGTRKHLAFAAICVAYERIYGESQRKHAAKSVLEAFRREGDTEIGCNRFRERGSNIRVEVCERASEGSCLQGNVEKGSNMRPNHVSLLRDIDGVKERVGFATIDLLSETFDGNSVPDDMLIVNVLQSVSELTEIVSGQKLLWKKNNIARVDLLFNFKRPIGNAILVSALPNQSSIDREDEHLPVVASYHGTDPSKAAIICDIKLNQSMPDVTQIRYPYAEWYRMNQFRAYVEYHFKTSNGSSGIPRMISSRSAEKFRALLWHKDWISRTDSEIVSLSGDISEAAR